MGKDVRAGEEGGGLMEEDIEAGQVRTMTREQADALAAELKERFEDRGYEVIVWMPVEEKETFGWYFCGPNNMANAVHHLLTEFVAHRIEDGHERVEILKLVYRLTASAIEKAFAEMKKERKLGQIMTWRPRF